MPWRGPEVPGEETLWQALWSDLKANSFDLLTWLLLWLCVAIVFVASVLRLFGVE